MNVAGIVAEYNPFHSGHSWHIEETRRRLGENTAVVCVLSGNWVQRGECAMTDKWTRAEMALRGGADLVLELPLPWAISSAEGFARGAVGVLKATGVVNTLSFGSESGEVEPLRDLAKALDGEEYRAALRQEMGKNISFPQARQKAVRLCLGPVAERLRGANDSLGVEYLRAAGEKMPAIAVPRRGAAHNQKEVWEGFASASILRDTVRAGRWKELEPYMKREDIRQLQRVGVARMEHIERGILAALRKMSVEDFCFLPDSGQEEGLPQRLVRAAERAESLETFYSLAKTKRYTHARIRRLSLWAFLGLRADDRPAEGPAYLRVLGMNDRGKALLKEMKSKASLPILTKPARSRDLEKAGKRLFELECLGGDLFGLCFDKVRPCGMDYTTGPVVL